MEHGLCFIMLQHEVLVADEWHDNRPQDCHSISVRLNCGQWNATCLLTYRHLGTMKWDSPATRILLWSPRCYQSSAFANSELQTGRDPGEDDEHADEFPWDSFWQLEQKLFCFANQPLHQLSGWLFCDLACEEARWSWASVVIVWFVQCTAKFLGKLHCSR